MRLVSFGPRGEEAPGVLAEEGILPLRPVAARLGLPADASLRDLLPVLDRVATLVTGMDVEPVPLQAARLGPPVVDPPTIYVCGANYHAHLRQTDRFAGDRPLPELPMVFQKPGSALSGPFDPVVRPPETACLDYEAELAVVIGRGGHRITVERAHEHVAGYMIANDVTARDLGEGASVKASATAAPTLFPLDLDFGAMTQLMRAKGWDTFLPTGPWLVTPDEAGPYDEIRMRLSVNDEPRQDALAGEMHHSPAALIAWISATATLRPGDIIVTGTPAGIGAGLTPPRWLVPGDVVRIEMTGLGTMTTAVQDEVR